MNIFSAFTLAAIVILGSIPETFANRKVDTVSNSNKVYVIAHRCNSNGWFDHALKWGANGVEIDITKHNGIFYSWHGDVGSWEIFDDYVDHIRDRLLNDSNGKKVSLLILDLKYDASDGINADDITFIRNLVKSKISDHVNKGQASNKGLFIMYGTYEGKYANMMAGSIDHMALSDWEGVNYDYDVGGSQTSPETANKWRDDHGVKNFLYSAGITAWVRYWVRPSIWKNLKAAENSNTPSYSWTFGYAGSASRTLKKHSLVGVLGNMDQNFGWLPTYLEYYGLQDYSLVTRQDSPPF